MLRRLSLIWLLCLIVTMAGATVLPQPALARPTQVGLAHPAKTGLAQSYSFRVPQLDMQAYVQTDGSVRIVYDITFDNLGSPIDVVDIGLPNKNYNIGNMSASIGGVNLSDIRTSTYINVGVEVHLGSQAIPTGGQGTLHFEATMPDLIYQDTTNKANASMRITPTWFDSSSVSGTSDIRLAVHLPEGIQPDQVVYQQVPFTSKALYQGHTVAIWEWPNGTATKAYLVGLSFPKDGISNVIKQTIIDLIKAWLQDHPGTAVLLGVIAMGLAAYLFFRFSGGTGCTVFAILGGGLVLLFILSPIMILPAIPILIALVIWNESRLKKKPKDYLPPIAQVEGGGIKRGLTAPEAAVLLELPLSKVLTLVFFGLLEKKVVELVTQDPLTVKIADPFKTWDDPDYRRSSKLRDKQRRNAALQAGTVIHTYELDFLDQLERNPGKPLEKIDFTKPMEALIKKTAAKMKGFDLSDTQEYYKRVISRAMDQAKTMGEVKEREKYLDKYLPWVMMNDAYPTVLNRPGYSYWPFWAQPRIGPVIASGGRSGPSVSRGGGGRSSTPGQTSFGDVAASFSGWAETTMGGLASAILPGSMNIPGAKGGGFINLSGVDRVTGDVFEALSKASSSGKGGGGGGSCACACAGCACACACAGGGR